ncbi:GNAT family N-acetyltransferase [Streptomyces sp. NPDC008141]|uniref:GNAT family N-acetyltransferase n=1 Tax=Streptomyces sp. NPDC008141 TaxID=3364815 RepID=UPI0036E9A7D8
MSVEVRQATVEDREELVHLIHEAFRDDPVSRWVFPDPAELHRAHAPFLAVFLDLALAVGRVDVTEDGSAAALWFPRKPGAAGEGDVDDETGARLMAIAGRSRARAETVGRLTDEVHPHDRSHEYLQLIAVSPQHQGQGRGTALLAPALERCDRDGVPAYLEASNPGSRRLYERLGFTFTGTAVHLPDGPVMWPMWREPRGR